MDLILFLILFSTLAYAVEQAKKEWHHSRDQYARDIKQANPQWHPRKVRRHARGRSLRWWAREVAEGFPVIRNAWAEDRDHVRYLRETGQIGRETRLAEMRAELAAIRQGREEHQAATMAGETKTLFGPWYQEHAGRLRRASADKQEGIPGPATQPTRPEPAHESAAEPGGPAQPPAADHTPSTAGTAAAADVADAPGPEPSPAPEAAAGSDATGPQPAETAAAQEPRTPGSASHQQAAPAAPAGTASDDTPVPAVLSARPEPAPEPATEPGGPAQPGASTHPQAPAPDPAPPAPGSKAPAAGETAAPGPEQVHEPGSAAAGGETAGRQPAETAAGGEPATPDGASHQPAAPGVTAGAASDFHAAVTEGRHEDAAAAYQKHHAAADAPRQPSDTRPAATPAPGSAPDAGAGVPKAPGKPAGTPNRDNHNGGNAMTTDTNVPNGELAGDSAYRAAFTALEGYDRAAQQHEQAAETLEGQLTMHSFDRDPQLMQHIRSLRESAGQIRAYTKQARDVLVTNHSQGDEYHRSGVDADATAFRKS